MIHERMKKYEFPFDSRLIHRCPAICRVDGRAFHTFTKAFDKPFDGLFRMLMEATAKHLCEVIPTAKFAYTQSDEISILMIDYTRFETSQFFDGRVQKLASIIASEATLAFNRELTQLLFSSAPFVPVDKLSGSLFKATFDCRVFSVPERDVANYFVWRQRDAERNSVLSLGQHWFSEKELHGKSIEEIKLMLEEKSRVETTSYFVNWTTMPEEIKRGSCIEHLTEGWISRSAPTFDQLFFERILEPEEE